MSCLSIIAAVASNRTIGSDNQLPWHLPEDLQHFRKLTMGHHIIMGRKTYESLGRLLPGRVTVIVSRNPEYLVEGALVFDSLDKAIAACGDDVEVFVIGGAELYREAMPKASRLYLTEIDAAFEGDAWFPEFDRAAWEVAQREHHLAESGLGYCYVTYERR